jgi:hypothetical protein
MNEALYNAILMMSIDTAEAYTLILPKTTSSKVFGGEDSIVSVITFYVPIVMRGKKLKMMLGLNGFLTAC